MWEGVHHISKTALTTGGAPTHSSFSVPNPYTVGGVIPTLAIPTREPTLCEETYRGVGIIMYIDARF